MREKKRSLTFFLMALFIIGSLPITNSVSAEDEVDNWPENDAWLHIELISWSANETVEWDNNGGLPDPIFKICIEADGENLDCLNTPTWENQMTLNNSWNYSLDIPDHSNILNITIECEDNDALNDDECDMNSELDEWKLYAEYNWSATPTLTVTGNGDGDGNDTWKNAASTWKFTIDGFGDEDGDGVTDNLDICPGTLIGEELELNLPEGCSWFQFDSDFDGIISRYDSEPLRMGIQEVSGGSRNFSLLEQAQLQSGGTGIGGLGESCTSSGQRVLGIETVLIPYNDSTSNRYWGPTSNPSINCNGNLVWNRPIFDINLDGNAEIYSNGFMQIGVEGAQRRVSEQFDLCGGGSEDLSFRGLNAKQIVGESTILMHCNATIYAVKLENNWNIAVDLISLTNQPEATYEIPFGDFDGNGKLDLIIGNENGCEIYYGMDTENFTFFGPQTILSSTHCGNERMAVADIDNDGVDDLVSYSYVHFFSDGSVDSVELPLDNPGLKEHREVLIYDIDNDSDLDIIRAKIPNTANMRTSSNIMLNSWFPDGDSDNIGDSIDLCLSTPVGSLVDSFGCADFERDTDGDGITDDNDICSHTTPSSVVDSEGCSDAQIDTDEDGIQDSLDECPGTPEGDLVNVRGCSFEDSQDLDSDNDGVLDSEDACPETEQGVTVDSLGCDVGGGQTMDVDTDGDGVYDRLDDCANTPSGATVDFKGCPMDSDYDGVYDGIDECPSSNNPAPSDMDKSSEVDSTGCFVDAAEGESDSGSAVLGCFWVVVMIGLVVFIVRKVRSPKQEQVFYAQPQPVIAPVQQQSVPIPQVSSREKELEHQSRQAQIETQRLRQQLANQAQITQQLQSEAAQKQMSEAALAQKQHELTVAQQEKEELEAKLAEAEKKAPVIQNFYVQDSVISGDLASTKNINQIQPDKPSFKDGNTGIEVSGISEEAAEMALFRSMQNNNEDTD